MAQTINSTALTTCQTWTPAYWPQFEMKCYAKKNTANNNSGKKTTNVSAPAIWRSCKPSWEICHREILFFVFAVLALKRALKVTRPWSNICLALLILWSLTLMQSPIKPIIDDNRCSSISIDRLILKIEGQLMRWNFFDRFSIFIDYLRSVLIDIDSQLLWHILSISTSLNFITKILLQIFLNFIMKLKHCSFTSD